jgi:sialidase-1
MADPKWRCSVVGPGGAIQTRTGRLVLPVWKFEPWGVFAVYSDDHGRTWHRGGQVPNAIGDECQLVELGDGRLLFDIRQQKGSRRLRSISTDNGESWSAPFPGEKVTPVCCGIERFDEDAVLWTGPKGPNRNNLIVHLIEFHGDVATIRWERPLYTGRAAYSDLTILKDKTVGVLFERGGHRDYQFITFTRFDRQWLAASETAASTSPSSPSLP